MSNHPKSKRQRRSHCDDNIEIEECDNGGCNAIFLPNMNDSGNSDSESDVECQSESDIESTSHHSKNTAGIAKVSYYRVLDSYSANQSKLEPEHDYDWVEGEAKYNQHLENEILLHDDTKKWLHGFSLPQLFELFFSTEMKGHIIEATVMNGYPLTVNDFDTFLGILILSTFNKRKSQRDYWSSDPLLVCEPVVSAMSRNQFEDIKSKLKLSKPEEKNDNDKAWRIREVLEMFRKNLSQFGFFSTALSIDEMMVKFHGRTNIQQFMQNKPERWGLKM